MSYDSGLQNTESRGSDTRIRSFHAKNREEKSMTDNSMQQLETEELTQLTTDVLRQSIIEGDEPTSAPGHGFFST